MLSPDMSCGHLWLQRSGRSADGGEVSHDRPAPRTRTHVRLDGRDALRRRACRRRSPRAPARIRGSSSCRAAEQRPQFHPRLVHLRFRGALGDSQQAATSWCSNPSTSCRTKAARHPSGSFGDRAIQIEPADRRRHDRHRRRRFHRAPPRPANRSRAASSSGGRGARPGSDSPPADTATCPGVDSPRKLASFRYACRKTSCSRSSASCRGAGHPEQQVVEASGVRPVEFLERRRVAVPAPLCQLQIGRSHVTCRLRRDRRSAGVARLRRPRGSRRTRAGSRLPPRCDGPGGMAESARARLWRGEPRSTRPGQDGVERRIRRGPTSCPSARSSSRFSCRLLP